MTSTKRSRDRGAAAVEFALLLPVLLLIIGAVVDFGRLFFAQNITVNAAREGARMMALKYPSVSSTEQDAMRRVEQAMIAYQGTGYTVTYTYTDSLTGATQTQTATYVGSTSSYTTAGSTVKCPTSSEPTDQVTVRVVINGFDFIVLKPVSNLFGGALTPPKPNGTATMRCGG